MGSFLANWKTSGAGILMILMGVAGLLGIKGGTDPVSAWPAIVTGFGLLFGKDQNVTGV